MNSHVRYIVILLPAMMSLGAPHNLRAGMENCRFALHWKPKFSATKTITSLCDNPATTTIEPNYSPNWNSTTSTPNPLPCTNYTTSGYAAGTIYIVIGRAGLEGVAAASFGIDYSGGNGVGIDPQYVAWTPCADGPQFPNNDGVHGDFPQPGGGLRICWKGGSCQTQVIGGNGVHAVVGSLYVYAYSPSSLRLTPNNNLALGPELAIDDCSGGHTDLIQIWGQSYASTLVGRIDFGGGPGYTPCLLYAPNTRSVSLSWGRIKNLYGLVPAN